MTLRAGGAAPDFEVTSSDGRKLNLADFRGKKNVVLYFYPADFTTVCTRETCGFRDMYEDLASKDTEIIGVSVDDDATHERFRKEHDVKFALVADTEKSLANRYEASNMFSKLTGKTARVTYVIDKAGRIAGVFQAEISASKHTGGVRDLVARLTGVG
jgi:peroxiredoxin Q/BCP